MADYPKLLPRGVGDWLDLNSVLTSELLVRLMRPGRWTQLAITVQEARDLAYEYWQELKKLSRDCYDKCLRRYPRTPRTPSDYRQKR
jgi:hypothetical protein